MPKNDAQLRTDVMEELMSDRSVRGAGLRVFVREGVVTLRGQVNNYPRKHAAVLAAERVPGVRAVADEIFVQLSGALQPTDVEIAQSVADALLWDSEVPEGRVKARIDGGWVWLDGEVDSDDARLAAERAVRFQAGVRGVSNGIRIASDTPGPPPSA